VRIKLADMLPGIGDRISTNSSLKNKRRLAGILILTSLLFSGIMNPAYSDTSFSISGANLSSSVANSLAPEIAASGSNVYVTWQEGDEIYYTNSTDNGATFGTPINLSGTGGVTSDQPQISVSGSNIYVVWREGNANQDIFLRNSTNNGDTFNAALQISSTAVATSQDPQLASSGTSVYLTWREGSDIFFKNSTGGGPFGAPRDLNSAVTPTVRTPQIAVSGNNIYVVWRENSNIVLSPSTDNGDTFPTSPTTVGTTGGTVTPKPEIIADGSNVYVISQNGTNISFKKSTDNGASFAPTVTLGSVGTATVPNQQIAFSGSNVYVVWQNGSDISFIRSTNSGDTFGAEVNLSSTAEVSALTQLAASGSNVFVVWREDTAGFADDKDIRFKSSTTSGANFGGFTDLSSNTILSDQPEVASAGNNVYVVWSQKTSAVSTDGEIRFSKGTATPTTVVFDAAQYKLSGTATITVTDGAFNLDSGVAETISGTVTSTADPAGITRILTETGVSTGVFTGTITFTTGTSSGTTLQANPGNTITATYGGISGSATIFSRSVAWDSDPYDRGDIAFITVTDQNSNINTAAAETIVVTVSSLVAADVTSLTLTETGINTGSFGGIANVKLIFAEGNDEFPTSGTVTVSVESTVANASPLAVDATTVIVKSDSDGVGITLPVTETGINTSVFTGTLTLTTGSSVPSSAIKVAAGDFVNATKGAFTSNALVVPNSDLAKGLLQVTITGATPETITAAFGGATDTSEVDFTAGEPGGGGGGIVRPSLVLDILAGASLLGGGGHDSSPPSFLLNGHPSSGTIFPEIGNAGKLADPLKPIEPSTDSSFSYPLMVNGKGYKLSSPYSNTISPNIVDTKEPVELGMVFYEASSLQHLALNFATGEHFSDKDPIVTFDNGKLQVFDPNGFFGTDPKFTMTKDGTKYVFHYDMKLTKQGEFNLIVRAWDEKRNSVDAKIFDAFKVVEAEEILPGEATPETSPDAIAKETVTPELRKESVDIMPVIEMWGGFSSESVSDSELLQGIGIEAQEIPSWFKETARWVVKGETTQDEFVDAIKYMYEKGIIT